MALCVPTPFILSALGSRSVSLEKEEIKTQLGRNQNPIRGRLLEKEGIKTQFAGVVCTVVAMNNVGSSRRSTKVKLARMCRVVLHVFNWQFSCKSKCRRAVWKGLWAVESIYSGFGNDR